MMQARDAGCTTTPQDRIEYLRTEGYARVGKRGRRQELAFSDVMNSRPRTSEVEASPNFTARKKLQVLTFCGTKMDWVPPISLDLDF